MKDYSFGNNVYELRNARHLSQKELGRLMGVSDKAVSRWENGSSKPRASLLPRLADTLGVSLDKLLGGKTALQDMPTAPASGDHIPEKCSGKSVTDQIKVNFIPTESSENGNYLCTWSMQKSVAEALNIPGNNIPERQRNALSEETLFQEKLYHPYEQEYRKSLLFLLDDGWDVPYGSDVTAGYEPFGLCEPDAEKFASLGNTPEERLCGLVSRIKSMGYAGVGLWISPQQCGLPEFTGVDGDRQYWEEKARLSHAAGVRYWKVDWGRQSKTAGYREMMTECVRKCAPGLLIEHARGIGPFSRDFTDPTKSLLSEMCERVAYSDFLRTYDVMSPFDDTETYCRVNALLKNADYSHMRHGAKGFVNVESQPLVAAGLGFNIGIMTNSYEVRALLRWQRICPPFSALQGEYLTSEETLVDRLCFEVDPSWWTKRQWDTFSMTLPVSAARNAKLPKVEAKGEKPVVLVSAHPQKDALAVATLRRNIDPNSRLIVPADVTVYPKSIKTTVGVFGYYSSLTLEFREKLPKRATVWAQCLLDDTAKNITAQVKVDGNRVTVDGHALRRLGHKSCETAVSHEPALIIKIC